MNLDHTFLSHDKKSREHARYVERACSLGRESMLVKSREHVRYILHWGKQNFRPWNFRTLICKERKLRLLEWSMFEKKGENEAF